MFYSYVFFCCCCCCKEKENQKKYSWNILEITSIEITHTTHTQREWFAFYVGHVIQFKWCVVCTPRSKQMAFVSLATWIWMIGAPFVEIVLRVIIDLLDLVRLLAHLQNNKFNECSDMPVDTANHLRRMSNDSLPCQGPPLPPPPPPLDGPPPGPPRPLPPRPAANAKQNQKH